MYTRIRQNGGGTGHAARMWLAVAAAVVCWIVPRTVRAADPCAAKGNYDKLKAAAEAADERYKKLDEPDWVKLPSELRGKYEPASGGSDREKRLQDLLQELKTELQKARAGLGGLTLQQAQANAAAAEAQEKLLGKQWAQKDAKLTQSTRTVDRLEQEIEELDKSPVMIYEKTIEASAVQAKRLTGTEDIELARSRAKNPNFKDFNTPAIAQARAKLDRAATNDEIDAVQRAIDKAIEDARQDARKALAAMETATKERNRLRANGSAVDVLPERVRKKEALRQAFAEMQRWTNRRPSRADVENAARKTIQAREKLAAAETTAKIEAAIRQIQPWLNARRKRDEMDDRLKQAQQEYFDAIRAKDTALSKAKARLDEEQGRIQRTRTSLQGQPRDEAYYQKLSQMTLHARATYELLMMSLVDLDCFGDVRGFMDALKQRMKRLDETRDQILAQAGAAGRPIAARNPSGYAPPLGAPVPPPRVARKPAAPAAQPSGGHFVLSKTDMWGTVDSSVAGWSGSIAATSLRENFSGSAYYKPMSLQATWDAPPQIFVPGTIVKLSCQANASVPSDGPSVGMDAEWEVSGSIERLESGRAFAGKSGSTGQVTPSATAHTTFRVGRGDKIVLVAKGRGNITRGPCSYIYTWVPGK